MPRGEHVRRELDGLVHQLAQAAPTHDPNASTEDEPSSTKPPDAAILLSLPGIGKRRFDVWGTTPCDSEAPT